MKHADDPPDINLADAWVGFRAAAMSDQAGDVQVGAMRCAFFGGAMVAFGLLLNAVNRGDTTAMKALADELSAFAKEARR